MPRVRQKGEISQKQYHEIEWKIKGISSYSRVNQYCKSPKFSVLGSEWYLQLYPNGENTNNSAGWMSLYLFRADGCTSSKKLNFDFGIRKRDGMVETVVPDISHVFDKHSSGWGFPKWFLRCNLLERKSDLAPWDFLTITCNFSTNADFETESGLEKLSDDLKHVFLTGKRCDATLKVKNEKFAVHRLILASRSPVFEAMFEANMKEKNTGMVEIVDCHPKAFKDFLAFIYTGKFENSSGEIFELYKIAHKYDVEHLKSVCVASIMANLTAENVVDAYAIGQYFQEEELKSKSQDFFVENFAEIISNDKWELILKEKPTLVNILLKSMAENTEFKKKKFFLPC